MPKRVDHDQRRQQISAALLRVAARDGLEGVSLRHVAAEAGVTAGMVQHYFPSKRTMMEVAMRTASARYEQRIATELAELGDDPDPRQIIGVLVRSLLPANDSETDDARVGLAFQSYAASRSDAAAMLEEGNAELRDHMAALLGSLDSEIADPNAAATALLATAEGLAIHMLSSRLPRDAALRALDHQIRLTTGDPQQ